MSFVAGHRLGRHEIQSLIGSGGMGEVYLAYDTKLERKVALKVLLGAAASNEDRLRRFSARVKLLKRRPIANWGSHGQGGRT